MKLSKMNNKQKKLLLLLLPAAIILFCVFAWSELKNDKPTQEENDYIKIDVPDLPNDEKRQEKEDIFEDYERQERNVSAERHNIKKEKDDFFGLAGGKKSHDDIEKMYEQELVKESVTITKFVNTEKSKPVQKSNSDIEHLENRKRQVRQTAGVETQSSNKKTEAEGEKQPEEFQSAAGFGIAYGQSYLAEESPGTNPEIAINDFVRAELLNDRNIKDNSEVIFILNEDLLLNNLTISKMSRLYCTANVMENRIDITCNTIRTTTGGIYNAELYGYNENYQLGIRVEGKLDKAVNRVNNEVLEEGAEMIAEVTGYGNGLGNVLRSSAKSLEKDTEILLKEGYIMLFKNESN